MLHGLSGVAWAGRAATTPATCPGSAAVKRSSVPQHKWPSHSGGRGAAGHPLDPPPAADPPSIISACMPDAALHNNNNLLFSAGLERVRHLSSAHCPLWRPGGGGLHTSKGNGERQCIQTKIIRKILPTRRGMGKAPRTRQGRDCKRMGERHCKPECCKQNNSV